MPAGHAPSEGRGENPSCSLPASGVLWKSLLFPGLKLRPCSPHLHHCVPFSPVCLRSSFLLLPRTPSRLDTGPARVQRTSPKFDRICKGPISKQGHVRGYWGLGLHCAPPRVRRYCLCAGNIHVYASSGNFPPRQLSRRASTANVSGSLL